MTTDTGKDRANDDAASAALTHAWDWFEFHANQRLTMIRFYLTVAGAIGTGAGYAFIQHEYFLSALMCTLGTVASLCFMRLDKRVSDLVKIGERALAIQQEALAKELDAPALRICEAANKMVDDDGRPFNFPYSYKQNFTVLFLMAAIIFFCLLAINLWHWRASG